MNFLPRQLRLRFGMKIFEPLLSSLITGRFISCRHAARSSRPDNRNVVDVLRFKDLEQPATSPYARAAWDASPLEHGGWCGYNPRNPARMPCPGIQARLGSLPLTCRSPP